jgi:hypothetical protein
MGADTTTTIQISRLNLELLDEVATIMAERHPELWGNQLPTRSAQVGFAADHVIKFYAGE